MSADQSPDTNTSVTGAGEGAQPQNTTPGSASQPLTEAQAVELLDKIIPPETEAPTSEATPPAEEVKSDPVETESAPAKEPTEAATPELILPKVLHPLDEADDPDIDDVDPRYTKIRTQFEKQREKLRQARENGSFGKTLVELAQREGIDPAQLADLVRKNIRLAKGDATATAEMAAELAKRGYKLATDVDEDIKTEAKRIYDEQFAKGVESRHIDEEFAREQAKALAARVVQARPAPALPTQPADRRQEPAADLQARAAADVNALDAQFAKAFQDAKLDYQPIQAEVKRRIQEQVAKAPIPPHLWTYHYGQTVRQVQQEQLAKQRATTKPQVQVRNTLTPSTAPRSNADQGSREAVLRQIAESL